MPTFLDGPEQTLWRRTPAFRESLIRNAGFLLFGEGATVMSHHLNLRWDAIPHDGAFAPVGISPFCNRAEGDDLLQAWCQERYESIEMKLYLEEANRLLKSILAEGEITSKNRRRARHLLLAIRASELDRRRHDF